jgi:hypothetical protein
LLLDTPLLPLHNQVLNNTGLVVRTLHALV